MPKITTLLRKTIVERAHGCCEYCHSQAKFATQAFSERNGGFRFALPTLRSLYAMDEHPP